MSSFTLSKQYLPHIHDRHEKEPPKTSRDGKNTSLEALKNVVTMMHKHPYKSGVMNPMSAVPMMASMVARQTRLFGRIVFERHNVQLSRKFVMALCDVKHGTMAVFDPSNLKNREHLGWKIKAKHDERDIAIIRETYNSYPNDSNSVSRREPSLVVVSSLSLLHHSTPLLTVLPAPLTPSLPTSCQRNMTPLCGTSSSAPVSTWPVHHTKPTLYMNLSIPSWKTAST